MLKGHLDVLDGDGVLQGWGYDTAAPFEPLRLRALTPDGTQAGWGLAHLFREDLLEAGCAGGWCAFQLRLAGSPLTYAWRRLEVREERTGALVCQVAELPYQVAASRHIPRTVAELVDTDPTTLRSLDQLRGCEPLLEQFIRQRGLEAFVRAAYQYLLERPADPDGLAAYCRHLRQAKMKPLAFLTTLADSDEYRARPRQHAAPTCAHFAFRVD